MSIRQIIVAALMGALVACAEDGGSREAPLEDDSPGVSEAVQATWDTLGEIGGGKLAHGGQVGSFCDVPAHSNGPTTPSGYTDGSTIYGYRWQCTEYAYRFLCTHYNPLGCREQGKMGRAYGNANAWFGNEARHPVLSLLTRYDSGGIEPPRPGDILAFGGQPWGHVAIVREVRVDADPPYISVIEQNVSGTGQDGNHQHRLHVEDGRYRVAGAQGWMRVPDSAAACGAQLPEQLAPADGAVFEPGEPIDFGWTLGDPMTNHTLSISHVDTDTVVFDRNVGLLTGERFTPVREGTFVWSIGYLHPACDDGECRSNARTFRVEASAPGEPEPVPGDEACNGRDDDDDGRVDEHLSRACETECGDGVEACVAGAWTDCTARRPAVEICDGQDNDCDGVVDDGLRCDCQPGDVEACGESRGECVAGQRRCTAEGVWGRCEGGRQPDMQEACDGLDGDCDGRIDEGLTEPWSAFGACGGFADECAERGRQQRTRQICADGRWREEEDERGCDRNTDGEPCADGRCGGGECEPDGLGYHLVVDPAGLTAVGACDPRNSRELYRGRALATDAERNTARIEFRKCDESNPSQDLTAWVVVTDIEFPGEDQLCTSADCTRQEVRWSARDARLTVDGVRIWPSQAALDAARCGEEKRLYVITDGRDVEGRRVWYQAQSIGYRKVCD